MKERKVSPMVISYMKEHLSEPLSLDEIAYQAGYSKFHLLRKFSEETGMTLHKYIQCIRLEHASQQLIHTNKAIIEIAFEAQYQSQAAFTQAFKQKYQCTPYAFRTNRSILSYKSNYSTYNRRMAA